VQIATESLPTDLAAAHAMIRAEREARLAAEKAGAAARLALDIEIERLKLEIARLRRERFGASSERSARIEQLELTLEDLEEAAAEGAAADPVRVETFDRRRPARRPLPDHLSRATESCIPALKPARAAAGGCSVSSART
jgi:transposase